MSLRSPRLSLLMNLFNVCILMLGGNSRESEACSQSKGVSIMKIICPLILRLEQAWKWHVCRAAQTLKQVPFLVRPGRYY